MWTDPCYCRECSDNVKRVFLFVYRGIRNEVRKFTNRRACSEMTRLRRETQHLHWIGLRSGVSVSDTLLTATTMKQANVPSHNFEIAPGMNVVEMRFLADADGRSCTAYVYVTRKNDDICLAFSVAVTAGQQQSTDGRYYADTLSLTDSWFEDKGVKTADASGNNRMSRLAFDVLGYDKIFVLFDISSGVWGVDITGF